MEYIILGDPHIKLDNLDKCKILFNQIEQLGTNVICLGDVFDSKSIIRGECLNFLYDTVKNSKLEWIFLVGNHDLFTDETKKYNHSLHTLRNLENVIIIDEPKVIDGIHLVPYYKDCSYFENLVSELPKPHKLLVCHQGFTGFDYGNGLIANSEASLDSVSHFDLVIAGHFHKSQVESNLVYVGTPFSHSFGESNQTKYICKLDTETLKLEWIKTNLPQHKTLSVDLDSYNNLEDAFNIQVDDKNYWRVILIGSQENIGLFPKDNFPGVKFIEKPSAVPARIRVSEEDSNEVKFRTLAEEKGIDSKTIEIGLEILKNVS